MQIFDELLIYMINSFNFSLHCAGLPIQKGECSNFWGWFYLSAIFICLLVVFYSARHILRESSEFKAYEKRKAARAVVASSEEMSKAKWMAEDDCSDINELELANKMRQQLHSKKSHNPEFKTYPTQIDKEDV